MRPSAGREVSRGRRPSRRSSAGAQAPEACGLLLDPVALVVLLVLLLHGAPSRGVGAALLAVLIFGGVEGLLVDLLGVLWQVVLHVVRQLRDPLVGHLDRPFVACGKVLTHGRAAIRRRTVLG